MEFGALRHRNAPDQREARSQRLNRAGSTRLVPLVAPVVILLAGLIVYANSFSGTFVLDDEKHVLNNPRIERISPLSETLGGRRPVVDLSLAINHALGDLEPWGFHAFNLAVHLLAGLTLFGLVRRTLLLAPVRAGTKRRSAELALLIALLWVIHPLQTQSVTYIIQRAESLMGLFYLLTLYCVIRGVEATRKPPALERPSVWRSVRSDASYFTAVLCCVAGMGSKAVMVTAPAAVLLYDRFFLSGSLRETLRRRWGLYLGLAGTWLVLVQTGVVSGVLHPGRPATVGFGYRSVSPFEYLVTQIGVIVHYLRLSVWPRPLCLDYGWPVADHVGLIVSVALILGTLLALVLWAVIRGHLWGRAALFFFLLLAPTSSFIPIKDSAFEHRMYLSLAPVVVLAVIGAYALLTNRLGAWSVGAMNWRRIAPVATAVTVLCLGYTTVQRNRDYQSALGMWQDVITKRPKHARAYHGLGTALFERAKVARAKGAMDEARRGFRQAELSFSRAVELKPTYADALYNLGNAKAENGKTEEAIHAYRRSLSINPRNAKCHYNLGNALKNAKRYEDAMESYRRTLQIDPTHISAYINLGNTLKLLRRLDDAIQQYHRALAINPWYANAHFNLGEALWLKGQREQAVEEFRLALEYDPNHSHARRWLQRASDQRQGKDED